MLYYCWVLFGIILYILCTNTTYFLKSDAIFDVNSAFNRVSSADIVVVVAWCWVCLLNTLSDILELGAGSLHLGKQFSPLVLRKKSVNVSIAVWVQPSYRLVQLGKRLDPQSAFVSKKQRGFFLWEHRILSFSLNLSYNCNCNVLLLFICFVFFFFYSFCLILFKFS